MKGTGCHYRYVLWASAMVMCYAYGHVLLFMVMVILFP